MDYIEIDNGFENRQGVAVALGNFDGVHRGHQKLISEMVKKSNEKRLISSVFVFKNHTKIQIEGMGPELICSSDQRKYILNSLGVERIFTMDFNQEIMKYSPNEFIEKILVDKIGAKLVVVGTDYRFGYNKSGNANLLKMICSDYNIEVVIIDPVKYKGEDISSTRIRSQIKAGNMQDAELMLGRKYSIIGKVVDGKKIGHTIGFPTANISPVANYVIPKYGVYDTITLVEHNEYISLTNVGINPTFEERSIKIESHLLNFDKNIYSAIIEIFFTSYIREEVKFSSLEQLINQIELDILAMKQR